jgi:hypothetical protein
MTLPPLLRPSYWFGLTPLPLTPWVEYTLLAVFAIFFFAGILVRFLSLKKEEKMMRRAYQTISSRLMTLGAFGLVLFVFSFERIYVLGMRAGYLLWAALLAWYAWKTYQLIRVDLPAMERRKSEREAINKWLPKAKT